MTLDFLAWTRLGWVLKSMRREDSAMTRRKGAVLVCGGTDQPHAAIINFLHRDFWTATCELVVNTDKQGKIKGQVTEDLPVHPACIFIRLCVSVMHMYTDKDRLYPRHCNAPVKYPLCTFFCISELQCYKRATVFATGNWSLIECDKPEFVAELSSPSHMVIDCCFWENCQDSVTCKANVHNHKSMSKLYQ